MRAHARLKNEYLKAVTTKIFEFAITVSISFVDPDKTANNGPSHLELQRIQVIFYFSKYFYSLS